MTESKKEKEFKEILTFVSPRVSFANEKKDLGLKSLNQPQKSRFMTENSEKNEKTQKIEEKKPKKRKIKRQMSCPCFELALKKPEERSQQTNRNKSHSNLGENTTCHVCFVETSGSVFMDCGHGGLCYNCAIDIWKKTGVCHLCRKVSFNFLEIIAWVFIILKGNRQLSKCFKSTHPKNWSQDS